LRSPGTILPFAHQSAGLGISYSVQTGPFRHESGSLQSFVSLPPGTIVPPAHQSAGGVGTTGHSAGLQVGDFGQPLISSHPRTIVPPKQKFASRGGSVVHLVTVQVSGN